MSFKREIIVTYQCDGFHRWAAAPDDVAFLRNKHRHLFKVRVGIPVTHNDRDREFFMERDKVMDILLNHQWNDAGSCEMIAEKILVGLPYAKWAEVWEDGENGARLERD